MKNTFEELNQIRHHQTCILYIIFCDFVFLVPCCEDYDDNDINDFVNIKIHRSYFVSNDDDEDDYTILQRED